MDVTVLNALGAEQKQGIKMAADPGTERCLDRLERAVHELADSWKNFGLNTTERAVHAATNSRHLDDLIAERKTKEKKSR